MDKEEQGDQRIHGKEIWRSKWKKQASCTIGRRWREQIELDGEEWFNCLISKNLEFFSSSSPCL